MSFSKNIALCLSALLFPAAYANAQYPDNLYSDNCGYSAVCAVLVRLNVAVDSKKVCDQLQIDHNQIRSLSFKNLKDCLEHYGLKVLPIGGDKGEVAEVIRQSAAGILHIRTTKDDHFVAVWKSDADFLVYDHPTLSRLTAKEFGTYLNKSTGNLLSVLDKDKSLDLDLISHASLKEPGFISAVSGVRVGASSAKSIGHDGHLFAEKCLIPLPEPDGAEVILKLHSLKTLPVGFKFIDTAGDCSCFRGVVGQTEGGVNFKFDKTRLYERIGNGAQPKIMVKYADADGSVIAQKIIVLATDSIYKFRFESLRLDLGEIAAIVDKPQVKVVVVYIDGSQEDVEKISREMTVRTKCSEGVSTTWKQKFATSGGQDQYHKVGELSVNVTASHSGLFMGAIELWDDAGKVSPATLKVTGLIK
jgi:hypothetical protein